MRSRHKYGENRTKHTTNYVHILSTLLFVDSAFIAIDASESAKRLK